MLNITELTEHPELLNRETLHELRQLVGQCPYYHAARLLMLENLFLLHDETFDEELRRAAIFVPDRRVLFDLVESANYGVAKQSVATDEAPRTRTEDEGDRTDSLISGFLQQSAVSTTPVATRDSVPDPRFDYMGWLEAQVDAPTQVEEPVRKTSSAVIDRFLNNPANAHIQLPETPEAPSAPAETRSEDDAMPESFFTEALAKAYVKQGRFEKAIDILTKISLDNPRKNAYFADQIRFLRKLVINQQCAK